MTKTAIGIIGFGRFGKVLHRLFEEGFDILVSSSSYRNGDVEGVRFASLQAVVEASHALFLTVPINKTGETGARIKPFVREGQLVVDVCSVKEWPYAELESALKDTGVHIWPTHPMFGPDSAKNGFDGLTWVSCEEDIEPDVIHPFKAYLRKKGLTIVDTTREQHDRMAAQTQGLTHFIGRFLDEIGIEPTPIDTLGYKRLMAVKEQTCHDTWELFCDLQHYNRFSFDIKQDLQDAIFKVTSRFLDTTRARDIPVLGIAMGPDSIDYRAVRSHLISAYPAESIEGARFDDPGPLLDALNKGDLDRVVLRLDVEGERFVEILKAMGRYTFRVVDITSIETDGCAVRFMTVERRRWTGTS